MIILKFQGGASAPSCPVLPAPMGGKVKWNLKMVWFMPGVVEIYL